MRLLRICEAPEGFYALTDAGWFVMPKAQGGWSRRSRSGQPTTGCNEVRNVAAVAQALGMVRSPALADCGCVARR